MNPQERHINYWLFQLEDIELNEAIEQMSLKNSGDHFDKLTRLSKWLREHYSATDFVPSDVADQNSIRIKREMSRIAYIDQECQEATTSTILEDNYDRHYSHTLSSYRHTHTYIHARTHARARTPTHRGYRPEKSRRSLSAGACVHARGSRA